MLGEVQLGALRINGDDAASARNRCTIDGGEADATTTDDGDGFAGPDDWTCA